MFKRLSLLFLVALLPLTIAASEDASELSLNPTSDQVGAARLVYGLLSDSRYHYKPRPLDDVLSEDIYDRYLDSLDGERLFFLAGDIEQFSPYRVQFDDAIRAGALRPPFDIFNVYVQRVGERIAFARQLLKQDFDFSADEVWQYERKDVPWAADAAALDQIWRKYVKNDWLRLKLAGREAPEIRKTLDKRYANLVSRVRQLKGEDVFQTFMNAYATAIEPHTGYMTPRTSENFNISMSLSLEGIGAVLQRQDEFVAIRTIVPGGPAGMSGQLRVGDRRGRLAHRRCGRADSRPQGQHRAPGRPAGRRRRRRPAQAGDPGPPESAARGAGGQEVDHHHR
jgi:carboxyl-terminal processing protease